tara:strand:+ start:67 stop:1635 length:1569 start_codon:yes stop_codon:yes gene_type:complete
MKAYIITVKGNELSEESANKTLESANKAGLYPELFYGINKYESERYLKKFNLKRNNTDGVFTKVSYKESTTACFLSHFLLWKKSLEENKSFVILEHDVNFYGEFELDIDSNDDYEVINIGKPLWGNKYESWNEDKWMFDLFYRECGRCKSEKISFLDEYTYCDCEQAFLHGAHAYIITPKGAKKLIDYYSKNGIIPADNAINIKVVNIADYVPFICEQVRDFSLVQRHHPVQEFPRGFLYGDRAWENFKNYDKKVMVFMCDGNLLDKVKPLIHNAKTKGKWDGDFVLIVPESVNTKYFDEDEDNDLVIYKVPDLMDATIHFHKIFLFDDFFKEWDWVFYSDLDVWYLDEIKLNFHMRDNKSIYAPIDRLSYEQQFDSKKLDDTAQRFVQKSKPKDGKSFQTCWMLFSTKDEEWIDKYRNKLISYYFRYHIYQQIALTGYWEQCVFNLVFSDCWKKLGSDLVQSEAIHKVWDGELTLDHLKRGYEDRTDYSEASGVHFTFPFAPWFKYNTKFYREWSRCNDEI